MKSISEFLVACADLLEAEGRALRDSIARLAIAVGLALVFALTAFGALAFLIAAVWFALEPAVGRAWTAAICAAISLILAAAAAYAATRVAKPK